MTFGETFHKIKGIEKLLGLKPEFYGWSCLSKIHSLYLYGDYDYEEWWEIQNLRLVMESQDQEYCVTLLFRDVTSFFLAQSTLISGFEIECSGDHAFGDRRNFYIFDFEEGDIRFYCKEIEVEDVLNREAMKAKAKKEVKESERQSCGMLYQIETWHEVRERFREELDGAVCRMKFGVDDINVPGTAMIPVPDYEELSDEELYLRLAGLCEPDGELYVITDICYKDGFGPFRLQAEKMEKLVSCHQRIFSELFFDTDAIVISFPMKRVWMFHHSGYIGLFCYKND